MGRCWIPSGIRLVYYYSGRMKTVPDLVEYLVPLSYRMTSCRCGPDGTRRFPGLPNHTKRRKKKRLWSIPVLVLGIVLVVVAVVGWTDLIVSLW